MLGPCFIVVSAYTILSCCVCSWVRSRPFLAVGGVISAAMAIVSGVGLLLLLGFNMTSVAYSMPFIVFCKSIRLFSLLLFSKALLSVLLSIIDSSARSDLDRYYVLVLKSYQGDVALNSQVIYFQKASEIYS